MEYATVSWTKTSSRDKYPIGTTRPEYITRVTLTGPKPSYSQIHSNNPSPLSKPTLPQTFELVGRDSAGNALITYGFELKQWFVAATDYSSFFTLSEATTWCNSVGYRLPKAKDLTNATLSKDGQTREIGAGLYSEWAELVFPAFKVFTSEVSDNRPVVFEGGKESPAYLNLESPNFEARGALCVTP